MHRILKLRISDNSSVMLTGFGYFLGRPRGFLAGVGSVLAGVETSSATSECVAEPLLSTPISRPASF